MTLPKISHPLYDVNIPSTNKKIKIRPMLVKEEKLLLMAKTSDDSRDILSAIKQVVNNCIADDNIDVDKLAIFDIEYLFLRIRAFSISNVSKVSYRDNEDNEIYDFEIDLDNIKVEFPENVKKSIEVDDTTTIVMKYAEASLYTDEEFSKIEPKNLFDELVVRCIDKIYVGDEMYDTSSMTREQLTEYLENFEIPTYAKMRNFVMNMPTLKYVIEYKNSKGSDRKIVMTALNDFFTLR